MVPSLKIERASVANTPAMAATALMFQVAAIPGARGNVVIPAPVRGRDVCRSARPSTPGGSMAVTAHPRVPQAASGRAVTKSSTQRGCCATWLT